MGFFLQQKRDWMESLVAISLLRSVLTSERQGGEESVKGHVGCSSTEDVSVFKKKCNSSSSHSLYIYIWNILDNSLFFASCCLLSDAWRARSPFGARRKIKIPYECFSRTAEWKHFYDGALRRSWTQRETLQTPLSASERVCWAAAHSTNIKNTTSILLAGISSSSILATVTTDYANENTDFQTH